MVILGGLLALVAGVGYNSSAAVQKREAVAVGSSHAMLTPEARARAGIPDGFLRFSIGLEDADDIVADLAQALAQL